MTALQELILISTPSQISLHDLSTSSHVLNYKLPTPPSSSSSDAAAGSQLGPRKTTTFVETRDGVGGVVMSLNGRDGKGGMGVWSFQKEQALQRLVLPTRLSCVSLSHAGTYVVGGTFDGRILLWEVPTGILLLSFDAHYRPITVITWTSDDAAFVTGSEDSEMSVWSLGRLLSTKDNMTSHSNVQTPYCTLSDHTLAISDIVVGVGKFPKCRVLSSSTDGTCKIWDLSYPTSPLLSTFLFPRPILNVSLDPSERHFFATFTATSSGPSEPGSSSKEDAVVYRVDLYRRRKGLGDLDDGDEGGDAGNARGGGGLESVGGGGRGEVERVEVENELLGRGGGRRVGKSVSGRSYVVSNTRPTSIHHSSLSQLLLLGTSSGTIHILSLPSLQQVRSISLVPSTSTTTATTGASLSSFNEVNFISTFLRPPDLIGKAGTLGGSGGPSPSSHGTGGVGGAGGSGGGGEEWPVRPVGNLSRIVGQAGGMGASAGAATGEERRKGERVVLMRIGRHEDASKTIRPADYSVPTSTTSMMSGSTISSSISAPSTEDLRSQVSRLKEQLGRALEFNDRMWRGIVDGSLAGVEKGKRKRGDGDGDVDMQ